MRVEKDTAGLGGEAGDIKLSKLVWGLDWEALLPIKLDDEFELRVISFDAARDFIGKHYDAAFGDSTRELSFFNENNGLLKERFYHHASDIFGVFNSTNVLLGVIAGNPIDWSSYHVRFAIFDPRSRRSGLLNKSIQLIFKELKSYGFLRIEYYTAPTNVPMASWGYKFGFVASGTVLCERWGALTRMSYFFSDEAESSFVQRYCSFPKPKKNRH